MLEGMVGLRRVELKQHEELSVGDRSSMEFIDGRSSD